MKYLEKDGPDNDRMVTAAAVIMLCAICILHAAEAGHYVDFNPINGTFQNFNPVRRLLSGQIPYRDFQDYLGLGHLFAGSAATLLFGGDFRASLIAFSFLTFVGLALILFVAGHAVFHKKSTAFVLTDFVLILLITQPYLFKNVIAGTDEINNALKYALGTGNSARLVRGMILPLSCGVFCFPDKKYGRIKRYRKLIDVCCIGVAAGFSFIWSNDYGISCWLCLSIMTFVVIFSRTKKLWKALTATAVELLVSLISVFLFVEIFTLGHFPNWIRSVFGTGGYQGWYYNGAKSFYLYDVDFSYIMLIQGILCVVYLWKLFKCGADSVSLGRYGVLAFMNMVCFCAVNEYKLLSGNHSREVAFAVLFATVLFEMCNVLRSVLDLEKIRAAMRIAVFTVCMAWIISSLKTEFVFWVIFDKEGQYLEALGGNSKDRGRDLVEAAEFLGDSEYFATYASAQEVISGTFQPSGTDYIIHVLGDDERNRYLECFMGGDFAYAATIKESFTQWEYWCERANWFFYRELYQGWHPVFSNTYEMYWERNSKAENNVLKNACSVCVEEVDNATKKIIVQADPSVNGIADVYIDYEVKKRDRKLSRLTFQTMLHTENTGTLFSENNYYESNNLRSSGAEYIPVRVIDGYGEITLTAFPEASTYLVLNEAACFDIYQVVFDYVEYNEIVEVDGELGFTVDDHIKNRKSLENVSGIMVAGKAYAVSEVMTDEKGLRIMISPKAGDIPDTEMLKHNTIIRIIRDGGEGAA